MMVSCFSTLEKVGSEGRSHCCDETIAYYDEHARALASRYEALTFEKVHAPIIEYLPKAPAVLLDVGAGSGRDAAALARRGYTVIAVEPSAELREIGRELHSSSRISWVNDSLPKLTRIVARNVRFDAILCSAVWMHLDSYAQKTAMARLRELLKPSAYLFITFRNRLQSDRPGVYETNAVDVIRQAEKCGLRLLSEASLPDSFSRQDAIWHSLIFQSPSAPNS